FEIVRGGMTLVPEGRAIFANLSVRENLGLGAFTRRDKEVAADGERVFEIFPRLKERISQSAGTLSGGEQQMLAIGRALMTNPKLLILDEATEGLAPLVRSEIWQCLTRLKAQGLSILVIDKNVDSLIRIADRHYMIERGRVVWTGASAELAAAPDVQHRYLGV
ncbi:MAG TPA: ATP-binding cassette domain-containing protein, partial [Burkholderiaceae bacterium]|nr:ATP-binding cassette domain-containing protein [Burkholderiaceae bacterium]